LGQPGELDPSLKEKLELIRLRNELRQLREQLAGPATDALPVASDPPTPPATPDSPFHDDEVRQLELAALRGQSGALDKLASLVAAARATNSAAQTWIRTDMRLAFEDLGTEAGNGNESALQTLWQASRMPELQGLAVQALGQAAGKGNEEALKPLLDPESYLILRSSAVQALKPAADAGNVQAIEMLASVAADQKQSPLWLLAAGGLELAAVAGNATAINALALLAAADNKNVSRQAVLALETAARRQQPQAEAALKKLGWR
jgi:hypothetical protein